MESIFDVIEKNNIRRLRDLIEKGINLNAVDDYGYSALHIASFKGLNEIALFLIDQGINLNLKDKNGQTALHYAALNNQFEIAKALLEKGADLSIADVYGNEPLWTAVFNDKGKNERLEIIKLFLEYKADKDHKNKVSKSPRDIVNIAGYNNLKAIMNNDG
jgi:ankyrin repeat protein